MQQLYLHFSHEDFEFISDRSARQFLKAVGTSVKDAQVAELDIFIYSLDLEYRYLKSMQDLLRNQTQRLPAYYIDTLKKGSLIAWLVVAFAVVGVFSYETVLHVIEDEAERRKIFKSLKLFLDTQWTSRLTDSIIANLRERKFGNNIVVRDAKVATEDGKTTISFKLETEVEATERPRRADYTLEMIEAHIRRYLRPPSRRR
jgi:hypothetical protein